MKRDKWMGGLAVIALVFLVFAFNACSSQKGTSPSSEAPAPDAAAVQVIEGMKRSFLPLFCADGSFFRECYGLGSTECEAEAAKAIDDCLAPMKGEIAQKVSQNASAEEGRAMGQKAGSCSAESLKAKLQGRWTDSAKCNDPSQWQ